MFKKFNQKLKKKGGFTLIELIIVIAILAILALIAVPRFSAVQTDAQKSADQATARTILSAVSMAEAKYSTTTFTAAGVASVNEFLNSPIVIVDGSTAPGSGTAWALWKNGTKWEVYYKGALKSN